VLGGLKSLAFADNQQKSFKASFSAALALLYPEARAWYSL
jgi:hypothetical protein